MQEERFAGIDWASEEHAACVVDEHGRIVEGRRYRHDERGVNTLCAGLLELGRACRRRVRAAASLIKGCCVATEREEGAGSRATIRPIAQAPVRHDRRSRRGARDRLPDP